MCAIDCVSVRTEEGGLSLHLSGQLGRGHSLSLPLFLCPLSLSLSRSLLLMPETVDAHNTNDSLMDRYNRMSQSEDNLKE